MLTKSTSAQLVQKSAFLNLTDQKKPETLIPVKVTFLCHRMLNLHAGKEITGPHILVNNTLCISYYFDVVCLQSTKSNSCSMKSG